MNSCAVCPASRCSSFSRSRVNAASAAVSSISHDPPFGAATVVVVMIQLPKKGTACLGPLEQSRRAHPAADTHRDQAVAGAPALHLIQDRRGQLGAGAA